MKRKVRTSLLIAAVVAANLTQIGCDKIGELVKSNKKPVIDRLYALRQTLSPTDTTTIIVEAHDPDEETLAFAWTAEGGLLSASSGQKVVWTAPAAGGNYRISVKASDPANANTESSIQLAVLASEKPTVKITLPENGAHLPGLGAIVIEALATHPNGIREVQFYVDNILLGRDDSTPYRLPWQIEGKSGSAKILARAFRAGNSSAEFGVDSVAVTIEGVTRLHSNP